LVSYRFRPAFINAFTFQLSLIEGNDLDSREFAAIAEGLVSMTELKQLELPRLLIFVLGEFPFTVRRCSFARSSEESNGEAEGDSRSSHARHQLVLVTFALTLLCCAFGVSKLHFYSSGYLLSSIA
jgi:hypothetical protein